MNNEPDLLSADLPMVDLSTALPAYQATYLVDEEGFLLPCVVDAEGKQTIGTSQEMTVLAGVYDFYAVSPARPCRNFFHKIRQFRIKIRRLRLTEICAG